MKSILAFMLMVGSCSPIQPIADDIEKIVDNDAITIKVDKDSFQKDTDVKIDIEVSNHHDAPK
jgi:hypothetical protein